ncbi:unnamed protein product [Brachionus calyciflorus]|uniref:Reverse transcriptase domain-containing protein n=1 Tax=Brachionus calyciflorus TaxID=104777 RepID=A0A813Y380_9BILA|nr:unnamed protein product [Brachionus calyciflorus]
MKAFTISGVEKNNQILPNSSQHKKVTKRKSLHIIWYKKHSKNFSLAQQGQISSTVLKSARVEIVDPVTKLFNFYINNSFVPEQWKKANKTPIPKVDHPKETSDYKQTNVTSILSKVFERIICKFIIEYTKEIWEKNKQHGFPPGKCKMNSIIKLVDDMSTSIDNKESILAINGVYRWCICNKMRLNP